jgi:hypothetical protein
MATMCHIISPFGMYRAELKSESIETYNGNKSNSDKDDDYAPSFLLTFWGVGKRSCSDAPAVPMILVDSCACRVRSSLTCLWRLYTVFLYGHAGSRIRGRCLVIHAGTLSAL